MAWATVEQAIINGIVGSIGAVIALIVKGYIFG